MKNMHIFFSETAASGCERLRVWAKVISIVLIMGFIETMVT